MYQREGDGRWGFQPSVLALIRQQDGGYGGRSTPGRAPEVLRAAQDARARAGGTLRAPLRDTGPRVCVGLARAHDPPQPSAQDAL